MRFYFIFVCLSILSCSSETAKEVVEKAIVIETNPVSEGFDLTNSDEKAIAIADAVMEKMGGRKAWNATKIIKRNFFGARKLTWNKQSGDVRVDFPENDSNILITNIFTHQGKIKLDGKVLTQADSIKKYSAMAESIWINDSYWLFMPFKLKDAKTTLKYLNVDTVQGTYSYKLELTFNEIGDTPENKYWVYVDTTKMLVNQWAYFTVNTDTVPSFVTPWTDYKKYGAILLAGNRGERGITEIEVLDITDVNTFKLKSN